MLTLVSYPGLYGLADNNPFGLKVYAFLRLAGLPFRHDHVLDASAAPRGQLPYVLDDAGVAIGDSDAIIAHLTRRHGLLPDAGLTPAQRSADLMLRRTLDDLYWVISYSRWKDDRFWPSFRQAMLDSRAGVTEAMLASARAFNFQRYHAQGIGRYERDDAYARGLADLAAIEALLPASGFVFGPAPGSADAGLYGFVANILFCPWRTPLSEALEAAPRLAAHCRAMHALVKD